MLDFFNGGWLTFMISSSKAAFTSRSLNWQMYPELKIGSYEDKKATLKQINGNSQNAHRRSRPLPYNCQKIKTLELCIGAIKCHSKFP